MKFTIERDVLNKALVRVTSVVEKRNTIPILANVVLDATENGLLLKATDLDMQISETVQAEVSLQGGVTLHAYTLREIVGKFPGGSVVTFDCDPETMRVIVKSGRSRFNLTYLPVVDFPDVNLGMMQCKFSVSALEFVAILNIAQMAMSTDEVRYYLNGIYLHAAETAEGWRLRGVATDGHRMARMETPLPDGGRDMAGLILPRKMVRETIKLLGGFRGDVQVELSPSRIRLGIGDVELMSKLIDGTFPDYQRVIPEGNGNRMQANGELLAQAVSRVAVVSDASGVPVKFSVARNELTVSARGQAAEAQETLEVSYSGAAVEIGFNARYLADLFAQVGGEFVTFAIENASSAAVITDSGEDGALYVLMPMRV